MANFTIEECLPNFNTKFHKCNTCSLQESLPLDCTYSESLYEQTSVLQPTKQEKFNLYNGYW